MVINGRLELQQSSRDRADAIISRRLTCVSVFADVADRGEEAGPADDIHVDVPHLPPGARRSAKFCRLRS
jgi:hypothetical protein